MLDEGNTPNLMETPDAPPPEERSNRTFWIVGGIMAGLVFLTLICMAVYFLVIRPRSTTSSSATQAAIGTQNAQNIQNVTLTAQAGAWTATVPATPIPLKTATTAPTTVPASPTPVIAPLSSPAATETTDPATLAAMQTELAFQLTSTFFSAHPTPGFGGTGMPSTGFFDEVGLPSYVILTLALVIVILLARRMRKPSIK
jgi:cytoskeletal protein RodZ